MKISIQNVMPFIFLAIFMLILAYFGFTSLKTAVFVVVCVFVVTCIATVFYCFLFGSRKKGPNK